MLQHFHEQECPLSSSADEEQSIIGCQKMVELKHQVCRYFFQLETPRKKAFVQLIYENVVIFPGMDSPHPLHAKVKHMLTSMGICCSLKWSFPRKLSLVWSEEKTLHINLISAIKYSSCYIYWLRQVLY